MSTIPRLPIVLGLILSAYAVYVEYRHATEDRFSHQSGRPLHRPLRH